MTRSEQLAYISEWKKKNKDKANEYQRKSQRKRAFKSMMQLPPSTANDIIQMLNYKIQTEQPCGCMLIAVPPEEYEMMLKRYNKPILK